MARRRIKLSRALTSGEALLVDVTGRSQIRLEGPPFSGDRARTVTQVGTVSISVNRPLDPVDGAALGTAPAGMFFTAEASGFEWDDIYAQPWKDLHFRWSFDDPKCVYTRADTDDLPWDRVFDTDNGRRKVRGPAVYAEDGETYIEEAVLEAGVGFKPATGNPVFVGHDGNIAYGPWVCHVFAPENLDFNGADFVDLTVRCEVRAEPSADPLTVATKTVRIANPDAVFPGALTKLISNVGDTANPNDPAWEPETYPGAQLFNDLETAAASTLSDGTGSNRYHRFLLRRGEEADFIPATYDTQTNNNFQNHTAKMFVGAYGEGHPPRLDMRVHRLMPYCAASSDYDVAELSIYGLDTDGFYDPTNPGAMSRPKDGIFLSGQCRQTIWDMKISGSDICIKGESAPETPGFNNTVIGNTFIGSWANYGMFIHGSPEYFGQCGVWVKQPYGTVMVEGKDETGPSVYADHGPIRCMSPGSPSAFNMVDYRSLNSWSGHIQPCNRYNIRPTAGDSPNPGDVPHYQWERARFEGGIGAWQVASTAGSGINESNPALPVLALFDKCYTLTISDSAQIGLYSGTVVRNTISVQHASPIMSGYNVYLVDGADEQVPIGENANPDGEDPIFYDARVLEYGRELYSCSFVDLRDDRNGEGMIKPGLDAAFAYMIEANNSFHAPNRADIVANDGPVTNVLWQTQFEGKPRADGSLGTEFGLDPNTPRLPKSMISAEEGSLRAVDDFFGRIRSADAPTKGAIEQP